MAIREINIFCKKRIALCWSNRKMYKQKYGISMIKIFHVILLRKGLPYK